MVFVNDTHIPTLVHIPSRFCTIPSRWLLHICKRILVKVVYHRFCQFQTQKPGCNTWTTFTRCFTIPWTHVSWWLDKDGQTWCVIRSILHRNARNIEKLSTESISRQHSISVMFPKDLVWQFLIKHTILGLRNL